MNVFGLALTQKRLANKQVIDKCVIVCLDFDIRDVLDAFHVVNETLNNRRFEILKLGAAVERRTTR